MSQPRVFVTRQLPEEGIQIIRAVCDVDIWPGEYPPPRGELLEKVRGVAGVLSLMMDPMDAELMEAAGPQLKIISNYAVGYDNIDVFEATRRGILVGNTPGVLTETTADLAFALIMATARRIGEGYDFVRAGKWDTFKPMELLGMDVHGATLGIIGMGRIGTAVARRGKGFDMKVLYYDHRSRTELGAAIGARLCATLDELLAESDFVSLHTPLTPQTRHLINAEAFKKMKKTAILVNTTRGPVVDSDALYDALKNGRIAYAGLDVTDPEPLPRNHPLLTLPNCLVVPHIGSASVATRARMSVMAAENLVAGVTGRVPPNLVNPEVLKRPG
ncbi:MAG: D-glycerate dehydrogenase [Syntrophales bacterium]|jgi:lactate dehydrogenase-like 2-hydroxyacid dehydrogenase|nr:D-glycerate dehydrogenase [Syntrophales bacterium]HRT70805.1 D-glycerate dehydrogenase [Syntrophales bacterium]